jgi:hypothetical protein
MKVLIEHNYNKKNTKAKTLVKIESQDLWEGNVTLAKVIYPFLKKYRNLYKGKNPMCGYPMAFSSDPLKPEGPDNPDRFNEWLLCLDKMVYAFGWIAKNHDWDGPEVKNYHKEYTQLLKPYRKELKKLAKLDDERFASTKLRALNSLEWDRRSEITRPVFEKYHKKFEEHHIKLQEGIDLFAKYFGSLWT